MLKIGVLCSGGLGLTTLQHITIKYDVQFVLTDNKSDGIITFSKEKNIPIFVGNPRSGKGFKFIKNIEIDVIVSINYLFLIEQDIIQHPKKIAFNIHGSLLPKYRGRTPHVWAIINGEEKAGITAHKIDVNCDTGGIIYQIPVEILPESTGATILNKYSELYIPLVDKVLDSILHDNVKMIPQDNTKATYFGKRTPDDGLINWNWHKERIKNWVRAQSYPYPGAFSFYEGKKIVIDWVEFSEEGFLQSQRNGEIIAVNPLKIKTPNGVLEITKIRKNNIKLEIGKCLE